MPKPTTVVQNTSVPLSRFELLSLAIASVMDNVPQGIGKMKKALNAAEYRQYRERLTNERYAAPTVSEQAVLSQYNQVLRTGDRLYARTSKLPMVGLGARRRADLVSQARHNFSRAHEILGDLLRRNPNLVFKFDRPWTADPLQTDEPESMPRPMRPGSQYLHGEQQAPGAQMFLDIQRDTLVRSFDIAKPATKEAGSQFPNGTQKRQSVLEPEDPKRS